MKQLFQRCPDCNSLQKVEAQFCDSCDFYFADNVVKPTTKPDATARIILLSVLATLGFIGLASGFYYLGAKSNNPDVAQANTTPIANQTAIPQSSPISNAIPVNYSNPNLNINTNTNVVNKPIKKPESNTNTQTTEKKRPISDAYEFGWTYFTETNDTLGGYYYFYKSDSPSPTNAEIGVWTRRYPMFPKGFAKKNELPTPVDYVIEKLFINCRQSIYQIASQSYFDAFGSSIDDKQSGYYRYQPIVPGTTMESLKRRFCISN